MNLAALLPASSMVPFFAYKAQRPRFYWVNPESPERISLDEHAYFIPLDSDPKDICSHESKRYLGERYGGHGLGTNGGGVRCGFDGNLQIKGIGKNPLVGSTPDFFHTYGGASINEGIAEAVWGEICNKILPYGAVRVHGLVATGTQVPLVLPREGASSTTGRALIIRDAVLRPAHYMRAVHFTSGSGQIMTSDTERTKNAIGMIGDIFAEIYGGEPADRLDIAYIEECLARMLARFGHQISVARAKRIMHGSLVASNISMDGRWLDFGTASTVPDFGHIFSPRGPDFLREELMMHPAIADLIFYLKKYLPNERGVQIKPVSFHWKTLEKALAEHLPKEFLKLTGLPSASIKAIDQKICDDFYRVSQKIIAAGNGVSYSIMSDNSEQSYTVISPSGSYHLNSILRRVAFCRNTDEAERKLQDEITVPRLRTEFVLAYGAVREKYMSGISSEKRKNALLFLGLNSLRQNAPFTELYRPRLYRSIEDALDAGIGVEKYIKAILEKAASQLYDDVEGEIDLTAWFDRKTTLSHDGGFSLDGQSIGAADVMRAAKPGIFFAEECGAIELL